MRNVRTLLELACDSAVVTPDLFELYIVGIEVIVLQVRLIQNLFDGHWL